MIDQVHVKYVNQLIVQINHKDLLDDNDILYNKIDFFRFNIIIHIKSNMIKCI